MRTAGLIDGRYADLELIGEGGAGRVYRALDRATGQVVALKLLRDLEARSIERFEKEARMLAELRHPHIVRHVAHGVTVSGEPYLAMEWIDGESLSERLERGPLGIAESVELARRVADGLGAAHARGVVHRDIKPQNLLLARGEIAGVRILDFGLALGGGVSQTITRTGGVVGTPGYMAPEQARGERDRVDARADVFSLGAVLFQCLTGRRPFEGAHMMAVLAQIVLAQAPRVRELRPEVPSALDALVDRLLAKDPDARPGDGAAVARALDALGPLGPSRSLHPPARVEAIGGEEQRMLALIALTSLTAPGHVLDEVHAIASPHGARIDQLPGGVILVTLTGSEGATEHAARAARCALRLREALPLAGVALVMGHGNAGSERVVGPAVDRAAELLSAGSADTMGETPKPPAQPVRIDDVTHALLDARFEVRAAGGVFTLVGEREVSEGSRTLLGKVTPYVGRDRELRMLEDLIRATFEGDRGAQAALVSAPAGMGKTRLRHELLRRLAAVRSDMAVAFGRADAMSAGSAYVAVASAIRSAMGAIAKDLGPPEAPLRDRLLAWTARCMPGGDHRRAAVFLGEMMGAPFPEGYVPELGLARQSAARMAEEIGRAFVELLRGVCARHPVLLVLDDLHWGDAASIRLLDQALRDLEDQPFVVLALARPEVHELFPDLWSKRGMQSVRLPALARRAAEELVTRTLGEGVSASDVARLVDRAAGNAFYLEELIRAYAAGRGEELPETVLGMVEARIEALPVEARRLLRAASVFGETFPTAGALALLAEPDRADAGQRWLPWLVQQELLVRRAGDEHAFRHALLREGSYAMLTDEDRVLGHRLAAEHLSHTPGATAGDALIGEHFFRGEDFSQAFTCFDRAGDAAARLHAHTEARLHYRRALAAIVSVGDDIETRRLRVDTIIKKAEVSFGEDPGPSLALLTEAEPIAEALPEVSTPSDDYRRLARIHYWMGRYYMYKNAYAEALGYYRRALAAAQVLGDEELAARPSGTIGRVMAARGHFESCVPLIEQSLAPLARAGQWPEWILNAGYLGASLALRGNVEEAERQGERMIAQARAMNSPTSESIALTVFAFGVLVSGEPARARALLDEAVALAERANNRLYIYLALGHHALASTRLGEHDKAAAAIGRWRAIMGELGQNLMFAAWFEAFAIEDAARAGRADEAIAEAAPAAARFASEGHIFAAGIVHRAWAVALLSRADALLDEAAAHLTESLRLLALGSAHVEAARTQLEIARLCAQRGDAEGAAAVLEAAARVLPPAEIAAARAKI